ncbi:MAG: hypothetical protein JWM34_2879 [Ilumatobacteraceae bacterium]|nr:hypothetical protein [Ilumatobacteraceae bacterium]
MELLLSSEGRVLVHVAAHPDATAPQIAAELDLPEQQVRAILRRLEREGAMRRVVTGRNISRVVELDCALPDHPTATIGMMLAVLGVQAAPLLRVISEIVTNQL